MTTSRSPVATSNTYTLSTEVQFGDQFALSYLLHPTPEAGPEVVQNGQGGRAPLMLSRNGTFLCDLKALIHRLSQLPLVLCQMITDYCPPVEKLPHRLPLPHQPPSGSTRPLPRTREPSPRTGADQRTWDSQRVQLVLPLQTLHRRAHLSRKIKDNLPRNIEIIKKYYL